MSKTKRQQRGYVVVWVVIVIAMFAVMISSSEFYVDDGPANPTMFVVFGIALAVGALGLVIEAKRDIYDVAKGGVLIGSIAAMIQGAVALYGQEPHPVAALVAVVCTVIVIACIVYMLKTEYGREPLPNILRETFHRRDIMEIDGIHFAVTQSETAIPGGAGLAVNVFLQNCWDAERQVTVGLKQESRVSLTRARLRFDAESSATLAAAEVGVLTIPIMADPKAKGRYSVSVSVKAKGSGGARVRRWRGKPVSSEVPGWLTIILALSAMLVWGGGVHVKVDVTRSDAEGDEPADIVPATWEVTWTPDDKALAEASRAVA